MSDRPQQDGIPTELVELQQLYEKKAATLKGEQWVAVATELLTSLELQMRCILNEDNERLVLNAVVGLRAVVACLVDATGVSDDQRAIEAIILSVVAKMENENRQNRRRQFSSVGAMP